MRPSLVGKLAPPPPSNESAVGVVPTGGLTDPSNSAVTPRSPDALYGSDQVGPLGRVDERHGSQPKVADLAGLLVPLGGAAAADGRRGSCDVAPRCADQPMLGQQEERSRAPWSSMLMFGLAVVLAVGGVLLLLPPRAVGAPLPAATESPAAVIDADGLMDMADGGSARTGPPGGADPVSGDQPVSPASGPPARISVEAIGVDAPVIPLDVDGDGELQVPGDFSAAGWWQGGAEPGEPGPTVVVGHVDSYEGPAVFYRLRDLGVGDEVVVTVAGGDAVSYRVTGTQEVPKDDFPTEAVYGHTPAPTLRLVTCGGTFDRTTGHYRDNTIVFAELS